MKQAIRGLDEMAAKLAHPRTRREYEARNLQIAGSLVARSALAREESRGAHYRTDFSDHNDVKFKKHSVVTVDKVRFE
jgi:L-aspartate oxidase